MASLSKTFWFFLIICSTDFRNARFPASLFKSMQNCLDIVFRLFFSISHHYYLIALPKTKVINPESELGEITETVDYGFAF